MTKSLETVLRANPRTYITDAELAFLLKGTPDSRYGKVKRGLAQKHLLHIRRGLYCFTHQTGRFNKPHPFELAYYIYGPSYISLESALSFHQLIPEAVHTITSVTTKRTKTFETPLGLFSYQHLPIENFFSQVDKVQENGALFFMAKPWKAICDYVYCYKKDWDTLEPLVDCLRINVDSLPVLGRDEAQWLESYYVSSRVSRFLKGVINEC